MTALFITLINSFGESFGLPALGELVINIIMLMSGFTGVLIIIGAIIWFAFGRGGSATGGKILTIIGVAFGVIALLLHIYYSWVSGILVLDPVQIINFFIGLGLGGFGIIFALIGLVIGGQRLEELERDRYVE